MNRWSNQARRNPWRAGCGESRTSGSGGGPEKQTGRKAGTALRAYLTWPRSETARSPTVRSTLRSASPSPGNEDELKRDLKPIYTSVNAQAARAAFDDLTEKWGKTYPAVVRLWENAWEEFIPFLDYHVDIRTVICSTDDIVKQARVVSVASERRRPRRPVRLGRRVLSLGRVAA